MNQVLDKYIITFFFLFIVSMPSAKSMMIYNAIEKEAVKSKTINLNNVEYPATIYTHPCYKLYVIEKFNGYESLLCGKFIINNQECFSGLARKNYQQSIRIRHSSKIFALLEVAAQRKFITTKISM